MARRKKERKLTDKEIAALVVQAILWREHGFSMNRPMGMAEDLAEPYQIKDKKKVELLIRRALRRAAKPLEDYLRRRNLEGVFNPLEASLSEPLELRPGKDG